MYQQLSELSWKDSLSSSRGLDLVDPPTYIRPSIPESDTQYSVILALFLAKVKTLRKEQNLKNYFSEIWRLLSNVKSKGKIFQFFWHSHIILTL